MLRVWVSGYHGISLVEALSASHSTHDQARTTLSVGLFRRSPRCTQTVLNLHSVIGHLRVMAHPCVICVISPLSLGRLIPRLC